MKPGTCVLPIATGTTRTTGTTTTASVAPDGFHPMAGCRNSTESGAPEKVSAAFSRLKGRPSGKYTKVWLPVWQIAPWSQTAWRKATLRKAFSEFSFFQWFSDSIDG